MTPSQKALLEELGNPNEPIAVLLCDDSYKKMIASNTEKTLDNAYRAFCGHWFYGVSEQRIQKAKYAVCIVNQKVYGIWKIKRWLPSEEEPGKWIFEGTSALDLWELKNKTVTMLNRQFEANSNRLLNID